MKDLGYGFRLIDKSILYYDSETFTSLKKIIDHNSFELIEAFEDKTFYFKDKNNVYVTSYMCTRSFIEHAKPENFEVVNAAKGIAYDGASYYWYNKILPYDYSKGEWYNEYYVREGQKVFFITEYVELADVDSFSIVWQNIGKDNNSLFFKGKREAEVDIATFKMVPGCFDNFHLDQSHTYYAFDQNNVYFINTLSKDLRKLHRVKPSDFSVKIVDEKLYGISGESIYYFGIKKTNI